ncbi:MAG: acylphosphatase [Nitrospira sp.]|nr:acylphosphatase [Nitrospira sp.]
MTPGGKGVVSAHIWVSGHVQGVGYRAFATRAALKHGVVGGVRNLDDGRVELEVEGTPTAIDALLQDLRDGPPAARVTHVETRWGEATGRFSTFKIWY